MKPIKVGILGTGSFAHSFIPLFKSHPLVRSITFAEKNQERLAQTSVLFSVPEVFTSFDDLLKSDCDAIAIFTPRDTHAPFAIQALRAGKHVYCAVPVGVTVEEIAELEATVRETGLTYMLGETSYYYPSAVFCREMWKRGLFGRFVYGEGEYMHDMEHGFYEAYQNSGGPEWKRAAGMPPMLYPTHSTSMILSVTGARLTQVNCLGQADQHSDGIFAHGANHWDNTFSNETALFRTSDGGMARINEFRRVGHFGGPSVRLSIFGTLGCFEEQVHDEVWVNHNLEIFPVTDILRCATITSNNREKQHASLTGTQEDYFSDVAPVHPIWRLPQEFKGQPNGHYGSHQFLVDDFIRACVTGSLPPNNIWSAARYNLPGLVAHQSALQEGASLSIPDLGDAPLNSTLLEELLAKEAPATPTWNLPTPSHKGRKYWLNSKE